MHRLTTAAGGYATAAADLSLTTVAAAVELAGEFTLRAAVFTAVVVVVAAVVVAAAIAAVPVVVALGLGYLVRWLLQRIAVLVLGNAARRCPFASIPL